MLIHDRFIFLRVRKTGSTFVADALRRELPAESVRRLGRHSGWNRIPSGIEGRPVLAYIRNPWDWYVSWYHFNQARNARDGIFRALSDGGRLDFAPAVSNACTRVTEEFGSDLYTSFFKMVVGSGLDSELLTIGRFESLIDDLEGFLTATGMALAPGGFDRIRAMAPVNATDRAPYRAYYDDALRELVGEACRPLVERFGYEF